VAVAAGSDLPMFAGARLFAAASKGSQFMPTGDFNRDGFLDVVTTDTNNTVSVLLGNGEHCPGAVEYVHSRKQLGLHASPAVELIKTQDGHGSEDSRDSPAMATLTGLTTRTSAPTTFINTD
jgi:hypothetical protein